MTQTLVKGNVNKKDIKNLKDLIRDDLPQTGIQVRPGGGYRSGGRKMDSGRYLFFIRETEAGFFEYDLTNGRYTIQLDMNKTPQPMYEQFMEIAKLKLPRIFN